MQNFTLSIFCGQVLYLTQYINSSVTLCRYIEKKIEYYLTVRKVFMVAVLVDGLHILLPGGIPQ